MAGNRDEDEDDEDEEEDEEEDYGSDGEDLMDLGDEEGLEASFLLGMDRNALGR